MKITVYIINESPFCTSEKQYLASHSLSFEEKNVETNKDFLSEMMKVSDEFAGVPFTLIVKDDGSEVKLKGFTKEEFDKALGFEMAAPAQPEPPVAAPEPVVPEVTPEPAAPTPEPMNGPNPVAPEPVAPVVEEPIPSVVPTIPDVPVVPEEPVIPPAPQTEEPVAPVMPPVENPQPAVSEAPAVPVQDQALNDVLSNLQNMSTPTAPTDGTQPQTT